MAFLSFFILFSIGSFNVLNSFENNWSIFLFEVSFVVSSLILSRGKLWVGIWELFFVFIVVAGVLLANYISFQPEEMGADWRRAFSFSFHFVFFLAFLRIIIFCEVALLGGVLGIIFSALFSVFLISVTWAELPFPEAHDWVSGLENFSNIRHLGYVLAVASVASAWVYWRPRRVSLIVAPLFVIIFSALLWTGGRSAIVAGFLGVIVCWVFNSVSSNKAKWTCFAFMVSLAALLSSCFPVQSTSMGVFRVVSRGNVTSYVGDVSSGRIDMWSHVLKLIAEKPIWGWGGEAYYFLRDVPGNVQAHNAVLQVMLEWGGGVSILLFGLIAYLYLSSLSLLFYLKGKAEAGLVLGVSLVSVLMLISMLDGVFYHGTPSAFLSFSCAVLVFYRKKAKSTKSAG